MSDRIQKILSSHGVASRREAERMILAGRITVGNVKAVLGQRAQVGIDDIAIDGVPLNPREEPVYIMLNKPQGYVTTMSDELGRNTVMSLVADVGVRIYPIGRLDINSEGLLLLTNDGLFANSVAHPSFKKTKTYDVDIRGNVDAAVQKMLRPMEIDCHLICAASVSLKERKDYGGVISIAVYEGRNRQIRRMCAQCELDILSLKRVSIGNVTLGMLEIGKWRYLTDVERKMLTEY